MSNALNITGLGNSTIISGFMYDTFINTEVFGVRWVIPTIIIALSILLITRDMEKWKVLFFPVMLGWAAVQLKTAQFIYFIAALIFALETLSLQVIGNVANAIGRGVGYAGSGVGYVTGMGHRTKARRLEKERWTAILRSGTPEKHAAMYLRSKKQLGTKGARKLEKQLIKQRKKSWEKQDMLARYQRLEEKAAIRDKKAHLRAAKRRNKRLAEEKARMKKRLELEQFMRGGIT